MAPTAKPPWERFADVVLQQLGLLYRIGDGVPPRDLAGVFVDNAEIDRILSQLPGLDGPASEAAKTLEDATTPARERLTEAFHESLGDDSEFSALVRRVGCSPEEAEAFALLVAVEIDPRRQRLVTYVQDNINLPRLTASTLQRVFGKDGAARVGPGSTLHGAGLVSQGDGSWATAMITVPSRVVWHLEGGGGIDRELPDSAWILESEAGSGHGDDLVLVTGSDPRARLDLIRQHLSASSLLVTPVPGTAEEWQALIREAYLRGAGVVLEVEDQIDLAVSRRIEAGRAIPWAISSPREQQLETLPDRTWREIAVAEDIASEDQWETVLGMAPVNGYRLTPHQLRLVERARANLQTDVHGAVKRLSGGRMRDLAVRIRPARTWSDLVLPSEQVDQLRELAARYRGRRTVYDQWGFRPSPSAGLVALFSGASGTGKTLAAEIIANDLAVDLYMVDLSGVVSKYIGETEKNLERIFTAAASGNEILFFDEADALFGKRSEVGDAHDRYANIEVAYLLQRLERHDGMVIMATNLQRNMDQAFLRRIHVGVDFPMPDEEARASIWGLSLPETAPTDHIDMAFLARQFKLSGGSIRNAALTAAFLAAEPGQKVSMEHLIRGVKREYQKLGRLQTEADFDQYFDLVGGSLELVES